MEHKDRKYETLLYEEQDGVAIITLNRPHKLNALNSQMLEELIYAFGRIHESADVRIVLLTGAGKAFMAGADITQYAQIDPEQFDRFQNRSGQLFALIEENDKPVIAAVNGYALGGGFEIILCCDLVVSSSKAQMGLPEIQLALVPGGGGTQRLPRKLGLNRAMELLLTGKFVSAVQLYNWGLVNQVVEAEQLLPESLQLAQTIAGKSYAAVQSLKKLARIGSDAQIQHGLHDEADVVRRLFRSEEAQRQIQQFAKRR